MITGQGLVRRADGIQGIVLGPAAACWPLGPPDLDHLLLGGGEQGLLASRAHVDRRLGKHLPTMLVAAAGSAGPEAQRRSRPGR
jgi:hypothetical protein